MKRLILTFAGLFFGTASLLAQLPGWTGTTPISITENSGTDLYDVQVKVVFNTENYIIGGNMQAGGEDIRFTEFCGGGTTYNHWVDTGINTTATLAWIKIDTLWANSTKTIFLQYGNSSATSTSAVMGTFEGPHSSTDSVATGGSGGVGNSQRGFRFAPNEDILVTSFGKREPTGTTRYVTLFDFATQQIIEQIQVSGPAAQYSYQDLANPIWLTSGTQYTIQLFQGSADGYYFGTSSAIGQHLTYYDMKYCNSCTQNTFPTSTLTNYHYGYPDLWYFTRNTPSVEPTVAFGVGSLTSTMVDDITICQGDTVMVGSVLSGEAPYTYAWIGSSILSPSDSLLMATPSITENYYLTATDACGSSVYDSVLVIVNPTPVVDILSSNSPMCYGESADLSITPPTGATVLWSDGTTTANTLTVSPTSTTTYGVTVTSLEGCTYDATFSQAVNAFIDTTVTGNNTTATLSANLGGATYQWIDCNNGNAPISGATGQSFSPVVNGVYAVQITINGCTETSGCHTVNSVSVTELTDESALLVFPNPNNGNFVIHSSSNQVLTLTDATGKQIDVIEVVGGVSKQIELNNAEGIYFLTGKNQVIRIVVQ